MRAETLRSILGMAIIMLLCYFLQSAFFSRLLIFGAAPLLLPLAAVAAGLLGSPGWGGGFGLLCGILCDAALGGGGLLFTVALTVMGFFSGFLGDFILARGFPSYLLLSVCALLLSAFIQMFRLLVFDHAPVWPLVRTGLLQSMASAIFILPLYFCVRRALRSWRRGRERSAH
ncbi:MAG: hypothetical protein IKN89_03240 [Oscillospiraceae bacterium]|nr:hypothetical protein [Oscillospiraceae bacterium]